MKVSLVKGKNFKNFIKIEEPESITELKQLKSVITRTEYKPFVKSFNKNITQTYLIDETYIPLQFLSEIERKFKPYHKFEIINSDLSDFYNTDLKRDKFDELLSQIKLPPKFNINLDEYKYQPDSVFRALVVKNGRIKVGTGGGKTLITYLYCKYLLRHLIGDRTAKKILIIVPKVDLVKQTVKNFKEFNKFNEPLIVESIYGGSKKVANADVVIGTYQSLNNYDAEYFDDFFAMIGDEVHTAKIYSIRIGIYNKCKNLEYIFGMTATYPEEKTIDYLHIIAMFGPLILTKTLRELIDDGNICDIEINRIHIKYKDDRIKNLHKTLKSENEFLDDEDKLTGTEIYRVVRNEVQNYSKRNKLIEKIVSLNNNHLILVENVSYLRLLMSEFYLNFTNKIVIEIHGGIKNREDLFQLMEDNNNVICVATYDTFSTGTSVNNVHYLHFPDGGKSMFRVLQGLGRGVRLHKLKKKLIAFDYVDGITGSAYVSHALERLKLYQEDKLKVVDKNVII